MKIYRLQLSNKLGYMPAVSGFCSWEVEREACVIWLKVDSFELFIVTLTWYCFTGWLHSLQLNLCLYFVVSFYRNLYQWGMGWKKWTRDNFLFMVGKWSRNTSFFLSSSRQALKTKLRRPSFQKSVIIVQNMLLTYLIYVIQMLLFPEHLCKCSPLCIFAFGRNKRGSKW